MKRFTVLLAGLAVTFAVSAGFGEIAGISLDVNDITGKSYLQIYEQNGDVQSITSMEVTDLPPDNSLFTTSIPYKGVPKVLNYYTIINNVRTLVYSSDNNLRSQLYIKVNRINNEGVGTIGGIITGKYKEYYEIPENHYENRPPRIVTECVTGKSYKNNEYDYNTTGDFVVTAEYDNLNIISDYSVWRLVETTGKDAHTKIIMDHSGNIPSNETIIKMKYDSIGTYQGVYIITTKGVYLVETGYTTLKLDIPLKTGATINDGVIVDSCVYLTTTAGVIARNILTERRIIPGIVGDIFGNLEDTTMNFVCANRLKQVAFAKKDGTVYMRRWGEGGRFIKVNRTVTSGKQREIEGGVEEIEVTNVTNIHPSLLVIYNHDTTPVMHINCTNTKRILKIESHTNKTYDLMGRKIVYPGSHIDLRNGRLCNAVEIR